MTVMAMVFEWASEAGMCRAGVRWLRRASS